MKKFFTFAITLLFIASCSSFDKYKTPDKPDAGIAEGEKSSYLLNKDKVSKQEIKDPAPKNSKAAKATKTSSNKKKTTTAKTKLK